MKQRLSFAVAWLGDRVFPAASTIKLPILIAYYQNLDAGKASLDEMPECIRKVKIW